MSSPLYRYIATARLIDHEWVMTVSDFPGEVVVPEAEGATLPAAGAEHVARHLNVAPGAVTVLVNHYRPNADLTWRDRTEHYPKGEHPLMCRVMQGGTVAEAVAEFGNWVNSVHDDIEAGGIELIGARFRYDPAQRMGDAPVEIDVHYELVQDHGRSALSLASRVVAALLAEGVVARIEEISDGDRAWITVDDAPQVGFVVEPLDNDRAWGTAVAEGAAEEQADTEAYPFVPARPASPQYVTSPLDGLGLQTPPRQVAAAIIAHVRATQAPPSGD